LAKAPRSIADQYLDNQAKPLKAWLRRPAYRDAIRQEITGGIHAAPDIVIAHSMGSLIAIDLIAHMSRDDAPALLVTLGSPLSMPSVWEKLPVKLQEWTATRSTNWANLYDRRDIATFSEPLPSRRFPRVMNVRVRNVRPDHNERSHSARRYLSHAFLVPLVLGYASGAGPVAEVQAGKIDALDGTHRIG
ncbi:MAG: hypothetical protein QG597_2080, partial [Actinomycetota bacterium]|nr:hypothetical protein [Actinomycetota bacterium]